MVDGGEGERQSGDRGPTGWEVAEVYEEEVVDLECATGTCEGDP